MPVALGFRVCLGCIRWLTAGARLHCCKPGALQGHSIGQAVAERRSHGRSSSWLVWQEGRRGMGVFGRAGQQFQGRDLEGNGLASGRCPDK